MKRIKLIFWKEVLDVLAVVGVCLSFWLLVFMDFDLMGVSWKMAYNVQNLLTSIIVIGYVGSNIIKNILK